MKGAQRTLPYKPFSLGEYNFGGGGVGGGGCGCPSLPLILTLSEWEMEGFKSVMSFRIQICTDQEDKIAENLQRSAETRI